MFKRLLIATALVLAGCQGGSDEIGSGGGSSGGVVRFIVLGDSGAPPESGDVAKIVEKVCAQRGCDFAVGAGDNIYDQGADSVDDPIFQSAFEEPYKNLDFPFFMALGNHDNSNSPLGGGGTNERGDHEVAYTAKSSKWTMPSRYYTQGWPRGSSKPVVELFVLDSSPITHFFNDLNPAWNGANLETYIAEQKTDMQAALAASKATWKFALAHHPYVSNGMHGNAGNYEGGAQPDLCALAGLISPSCRGADYKVFLEQTICDKVDVFFNGHDHELYWLKPVAACGKTHHILSGAASKHRGIQDEARNEAFYQVGDTHGFFWVELRGNRFTGAAYRVGAGGIATDVDDKGEPKPAFEMSFTK